MEIETLKESMDALSEVNSLLHNTSVQNQQKVEKQEKELTKGKQRIECLEEELNNVKSTLDKFKFQSSQLESQVKQLKDKMEHHDLEIALLK